MKRLGLTFILVLLVLLFAVSAFAADTVYVDSTGKDGAYTTLAAAAEAVDDGGTIVIVSDITTPNAVLTLPKTVTITSVNGAVLTLGRTLRLGGDLTLENITLANGASAGQDFIYSCGHTLIAESSVTTVANPANNRFFIVYTGNNTAATVGGNVVLRGGSWRTVYAGTYQTTQSGNVSVEVDGATITNSLVVGNSNKGANTANVSITV